MIFDAPEVLRLVQTYGSKPDFMVPEIVFLARTERFTPDRAHLEQIISGVPTTKQKDWLGRLLSVEHDQFRGAWFEMMLYDWLKALGPVEVEPLIAGNYPDYSVQISGQQIIVEARAVLETPEERERDWLEEAVLWALAQVERPYHVEILALRSTGPRIGTSSAGS